MQKLHVQNLSKLCEWYQDSLVSLECAKISLTLSLSLSKKYSGVIRVFGEKLHDKSSSILGKALTMLQVHVP